MKRIGCCVVAAVSVLGLSAAAMDAAPLDSAWTYQGKIEASGVPLNGTADFQFSLWDDVGTGAPPVGGTQIGSPLGVTNVAVVDGVFTVELDFGVPIFSGEARWLQIAVRSPTGGGAFTTLAPRQAITAVPYSLETRGMFVDGAGNIGIGTTSPTSTLDVAGTVTATAFVGNGSGLTGLPIADGHSLDAADGSPTDALFVDNAGNVGIGTSTPVDKLTVSQGSIRADRGSATANRQTTLTLNGAQTSSINPFASLAFGNYDTFGLATDYTGALIQSYNTGNNAGDLRFSTKSTANGSPVNRMTITPAGDVGIGLTSPTSKLHVGGTVTATAFVGDGSGLTGIGGPWLELSGNIFYNGGNVGIGTSTPTEVLHLAKAGGAPTVRLENTSGGTAGFELADTDQEYEMRLTSGNKLTFLDKTAGGLSRMTIDTTGNVGIGTASPGSSLHVDSAANWPTAIFGSASTSGTWLRLGNTTTGGRSWNLISSGEGNGEGAGRLLFNDQSGGGTRMLIDDSGNVGIGTTSPVGRLSIANGGSQVGITQGQLGGSAMELTTRDGSGGQPTRVKINAGVDDADIEFYTGARGAETLFAQFDHVTDGGRMNLKDATGVNRVNAQATANGGQVVLNNTAGSTRASMFIDSNDGGVARTFGPNGVKNTEISYLGANHNHGFVGVYSASGVEKAAIFVNSLGQGQVNTDVLQLLGGADIAEPFRIQAEQELKPGMVVSIDPDNAGQLRLATEAYDKTVAGVISGAGGVNPAMTLQQKGTIADGDMPVALTGRVYVHVDADGGPVKPGDLLTTSNTPGHAMRVADPDRAHGAIIGKAMTSLDKGKGLVLVLVSLH